MENNMKLIREFNSPDVEVFRIVNNDWSKTLCYFMIIDLHRKSTLIDYPELKNIENEKEFGRDNLIKVYVVSEKELSDELTEEVSNIILRLTEYSNQSSCDIRIEFKQTDLTPLLMNKEKMFIFFDNILAKENVKISIANISNENFNNLSQKTTPRKALYKNSRKGLSS